jgi:TonB family protein
MGRGDAGTAARMPVIFLISAAFHCALILTVIQVHGHAGGKCTAHETVVEVALVSFGDRAEAATTPRNAGKNNPGPASQRKTPPVPLRAGSVAAMSDAKEKAHPARAKAGREAHRSKADTSRRADSAPDLPAKASAGADGAGRNGVGLSRTASNHGPDTPPDSHRDPRGGRGAPESAPGHQKISAALQGTGKEEAKRGYLIENFFYIKNRITRHLSYPPVARRLKWQGMAVVTFFILENGLVENIKIASSSGHPLLDNHVIDTVKRLQPFPKPPVRAEITIPIKYILND